MTRRPPFAPWLLQQTDRNDPVGDVARDAKADPDFPRGDSIDEIETYLLEHGCEGARQALQSALREWRGLR